MRHNYNSIFKNWSTFKNKKQEIKVGKLQMSASLLK